MNKTILLLGGLLLVQGGIATGLYVNQQGTYKFEASEPLVAFDQSAMTEVTISDADDNTITLARKDDTWSLPALEGFPANQNKANRLLSSIAGFKRGVLVSDQRASAERFGVGDNGFERKISLTTSDGPKSILFGESPSFKYIYARNADDASVYTVTFSAIDAPVELAAWADNKAFEISQDTITQVKINDVVLRKSDDGFSIVGISSAETPKDEAISALVKAASTLSFDTVQVEAPEDVDFAQPIAVLAVDNNAGTNLVVKFAPEATQETKPKPTPEPNSEPGDGSDDTSPDEPASDAMPNAYWFTAEGRTGFFRIGRYRVADLIDAKRSNLVEIKAKEEPEPSIEDLDAKPQDDTVEAKPEEAAADIDIPEDASRDKASRDEPLLDKARTNGQ